MSTESQEPILDKDSEQVEEPLETHSSSEVAELVKDPPPTVEGEEDWSGRGGSDATDLSDVVFKDPGDSLIGSGGFGEVYKGIWIDNPSSLSSTSSLLKSFDKLSHRYDKPVAIKVIRSLVAAGPKREAVIRVSKTSYLLIELIDGQEIEIKSRNWALASA